MTQSLQLRLGQQLAMTPQLQQAIKLLQLSSLDLQQEIQQALDSNMMLEVSDDDGTALPVSPGENLSEAPVNQPEPEYRELTDMDASADIPQELALDASWEEFYDSLPTLGPSGGSSGDSDGDDFMVQRSAAQTLHDSLVWQMELTNFSDRDYAIATTIIDSIDDDGYLMISLDDIHLGLASQMQSLEADEVRAVLHRIQNFDPPGVGATDLADCLGIQLRQLPEGTRWKEEALALVSQHLDLLARKDLAKLKRSMELEDEALTAIVGLIRGLEPKPGSKIASSEAQYITPDVYVVRQGERWTVALNPEIAPRLRVNPLYSGMVKRADSSTDNTTMRNHLQEARWFIKSLHSRNETLLKVAKSIIERQQAFLNEGETGMKPMVLRDIAEEVGMHESTISRVTTQKYIHTPNGIFEFKYFFSSHVSTKGGGECSATAIKAYLKEIISSEDPRKPLSDDTIAKQLQGRGINVARRTIAKYREAMSIAPSSERKQIF
ncbi:MAG: RNA polymerase factor sigma-54 [Methylococcaceae bacterium]